jgi:hypothetical protein
MYVCTGVPDQVDLTLISLLDPDPYYFIYDSNKYLEKFIILSNLTIHYRTYLIIYFFKGQNHSPSRIWIRN